MNDQTKNILNSACRRVLKPFASMLLKCGMTWKEFSDISKSVFVEAATDEYGISGRPTNVSRVSILTGISRKEVKRQRDLISAELEPQTRKTNDATRLLSAWFQDKAYLDAESRPRILDETGDAPSFESLCLKYGGDIATPTMLKELIKTKGVERLPNGELKVLSRYYQPAIRDDENLLFAVDRIHDVIATMNNNVFPNDGGDLRFGGYADNESIPLDAVPEFREYMDKRGQAFLEDIDNWLTNHASSDASPAEQTLRVGVSLFATQE
jgi:uncharacterized protein DUF6502